MVVDKTNQFQKMQALFQAAVEKDPNAVSTLDERYMMSYIPYGIHTLPMLEVAIGRQGLPAGKIVEVYGEPHTGKTTFAYHAIAETQTTVAPIVSSIPAK